MDNFGPRLRALRKEKGLNRKELATAIQSSPAYIAQLESQFRSPGTATVMKLATALNVSLEELLTGKTAAKVA